MNNNRSRAEIIVNGLVQGVGFRYFVLRNAAQLGLKGYVQNLFSGEVITIVEGDKALIEDLYRQIKVGPPYASVNNCIINWHEFKNEFKDFKVKY